MREKPTKSMLMRNPEELECRESRELKDAPSVMSVLQKTAYDVLGARQQIAYQNCKLEELSMKLNELFPKVDALINVAQDLKAAVHSSNQTNPSTPDAPDDPQVEELATRIDNAVQALRGNGTPVTLPDPNAPVNPTPLPPIQDPSVLNPPDPNAPVV